jgi:1-hydroxycarotenoid 3,4-desaturase
MTRVVIIGGGSGGLSAAIRLAAAGCEVTVLERAAQVGGKMRGLAVAGRIIDSGPTVFTMRWVFDELFAASGSDLAAHVTLTPLEVLARHAWDAGSQFDLFADEERTVAAIGAFAGAAEARRYRTFCADSRRIFELLERPFLRRARPSLPALLTAGGVRGALAMRHIEPFTTLWRGLGRYFHDGRLRQLFARYATYCGASPFAAPATLMLVAHVERAGVWSVAGGLGALAAALAARATALGAVIRTGTEVAEVGIGGGRVRGVRLASGEHLAADAVIVNADVSALGDGRFGKAVRRAVAPVPRRARSLSAMTFSCVGAARGFPLARHNVFFSGDYRAEFDALGRGAMPADPTVYVCAQDRDDGEAVADGAPERLLLLINAPANGDSHAYDAREVDQCAQRTLTRLQQCGLDLTMAPADRLPTTPADFARLFPATGGALYGRSSHGWTASFRRPGVRTVIPGLYLAGGSSHPGPGVPMAALAGQSAAQALLSDRISAARSAPMAMRGGMSTR